MAKPYVIGLTGSIGMGKTETAKLFGKLGVGVYDSDAAVHRLYDKGGTAVAVVGQLFPHSIVKGAVDRKILRAHISKHPGDLAKLNAAVHPLIAQDREVFLKAAENRNAEMVVLDIPLLFETGAHTQMDTIVVVSAPADIQRTRVMARPGMSEALFQSLLQRQMPDEEKRAKAHFVVATDQGLDHACDQVRVIIQSIRDKIYPQVSI